MENNNSPMKILVDELCQADADYSVGRPTISDYDYDKKFEQLSKLELETGIVLPHSPTRRAGINLVNGFKKVPHPTPMMSLENAFTAEDVHSRLLSEGGEGVQVVVEPKIDGLAVRLVYKGGILVQAVTRGDHEVGDDVTENVRTIRDIPLRVDPFWDFEVRGEVYMRKDVFTQLNADLANRGEEPFVNARNAASGSLKQKSSIECANRKLSFIAYQYVADNNEVYDRDDERFALTTQLEVLSFLSNYFPTATKTSSVFGTYTLSKSSGSLLELKKAIALFDYHRQGLPYDTDGAVIKVNDLALQEKLGAKTRTPRWAAAFKYAAPEVTTVLNGIVLQVGRRGTITPVGQLQPVFCDGATIQRATLCNSEEIDRLGVNIGDVVVVTRQGGVIPKIQRVAEKKSQGTYLMPQRCPSCGGALAKRGASHFCDQVNCKDQIQARLEHAVAKGALDWDGMGSESIAKFIALGVARLSGLLSIDIAAVNKNFGAAFAAKFASERERVKGVPLWRKIFALGIDGVGQTMSKNLCGQYNSLVEMVDAGPKLQEILGPVAAGNFTAALIENISEIELLESLGFVFADQPKAESTGAKTAKPLAGKTFVITGTMMSGTRPQVSAWIESMGGNVKGGVTKGVDYLVAGDGGGAGKASAAAKYGTKVISEDELYAMASMAVPVVKVKMEEW